MSKKAEKEVKDNPEKYIIELCDGKTVTELFPDLDNFLNSNTYEIHTQADNGVVFKKNAVQVEVFKIVTSKWSNFLNDYEESVSHLGRIITESIHHKELGCQQLIFYPHDINHFIFRLATIADRASATFKYSKELSKDDKITGSLKIGSTREIMTYFLSTI